MKHRRLNLKSPTCLSESSFFLRLGLLLLLTVLGFTRILAQEKNKLVETGLPRITNYYADDYKAEAGNWSIVQDDQGLLYVANDGGLLTFDGAAWRLFSDPVAGLSRTLTKDRQGRIWGGNIGDLGYYAYDSIGQMAFVSMKHSIPKAYRNFQDVWMAHAMGDTLMFLTTYQVFQYVPALDSMKVFESEGAGFHTAAFVNGTYFIREWDVGLKRLVGDRLVLVPGGERFRRTRIYSILPFGKDRMLVCTREEGLFIYDGQTFTAFSSEADPYLKATGIYHASALPNGYFALATLGNGLLIIDQQGKLINQLNVSNGLADNTAFFTFVDKEGALWAGLENGLSRVAVSSPFTYFWDKESNIGVIYDIKRYQGALYIGSSRGVSRLDPLSGQFVPVGRLRDQVLSLEIIGDQLYCGGYGGLFRVQNNLLIAEEVIAGRNVDVTALLPSKRDSNLLFAGLQNGLSCLYKTPDSQWKEKAYIKGTEGEVFNIVEDNKGNLWLGYANANLRRVRFPEWPDLDNALAKTYYPGEGLSEGGKLIFELDGAIYASKNGTFKWREKEDRFETAPFFGQKDILEVNKQGGIWLANNRFSGLSLALPDENGNYVIQKGDLTPLADAIISTIYQEASGIAWISTDEGLVKYDSSKSKPEAAFPTLIRKITIGQDSIVYAGHAGLPKLIIDFAYNNLSFEFGAPSFSNPEKTQYQTWLEGRDKKWSSWSTNPVKNYLSLKEGKYKLRVRAQDIHGQIGEEAVFQFVIPSPWYRQWWAYVSYILAALVLVYLLVRWRTIQLRKSQEKLEALVQERTRELSIVNQVSRALSEQLDRQELIRLVGDQIRDLFEANIVYVGLLDESRQTIFFPYQHGDSIPPLPLGEGLTSNIILNKEPVLINREIDKRYEELGISQKGKLAASYLGVPIPSGNKVIGVLSVQSTEHENRFDENDQNLLTTMAAHVGIAFHNAKLFEDTRLAKAAAEAANEAKSSFLSTVSHELRTPLTSILGFAKIIQKRLNDRIFPNLPTEKEKVARSVQQIKENLLIVISEGERLTTLINDVLDLAKIEAGKVEWQMEKLSVADVIKQAKGATAALFQEKRLSYTEEIADDLPEIIGDRDKIIQVLINLLSNAVKFTKQGGVLIRAQQTEEGVEVQVSDTGIGIAAEDMLKVFDKFRQVGDTLTDKPKGTGLGLPISKEIIEQHGGRLWAVSELGKGSTFSFLLPLSPSQKGKARKLHLEALIDQLKKQVPISYVSEKARSEQIVLVVDDEASIRELLRQELSEFGYQVKTAESGKKALSMIRNHRPDIIILDVMMPEMNGFDLAAILKNDPNTMDIPILILSIIKDKERGYRIGVDRYLTKPIDTDVLFAEVEQLLHQGVSSKKVLVVDENLTTINTLTEVLSARGYQVAESEGHDLMEKARNVLPDIIILNSELDGKEEIVKSLRFEKGLENVLLLFSNVRAAD